MVQERTRQEIENLSNDALSEAVQRAPEEFPHGTYAVYAEVALRRGMTIRQDGTIPVTAIVPAKIWKRIVNYLVDLLIVFVPIRQLLIGPIANGELSPVYAILMIYLVWALYCLGSEWIFDRTLGKVLTATKVVSMDGTVPSTRQVVIRSFSRLIPGNDLAAMFTGLALHERLSKTRCVSAK